MKKRIYNTITILITILTLVLTINVNAYSATYIYDWTLDPYAYQMHMSGKTDDEIIQELTDSFYLTRKQIVKYYKVNSEPFYPETYPYHFDWNGNDLALKWLSEGCSDIDIINNLSVITSDDAILRTTVLSTYRVDYVPMYDFPVDTGDDSGDSSGDVPEINTERLEWIVKKCEELGIKVTDIDEHLHKVEEDLNLEKLQSMEISDKLDLLLVLLSSEYEKYDSVIFDET